MAIHGKNLSAGAQVQSRLLLGNVGAQNDGSYACALAASNGIVDFAHRGSIQVTEVGVTVTRGSVGTNATTNAVDATLAFWHQPPGKAAAKIATAAVASRTVVGSEFTSRDGTVTWVAAYDHPSKRVFPKGTMIGIEWDSAGDGNTGSASDAVVCWVAAPEFGAPPN
tara:strand:- start:836 stop:1336 length:501 start_codon:yes stop_codon:yes gene_type:complete